MIVDLIADPLAGLKLALTGAVKDVVLGEVMLVDFLLYALNLPMAGAARHAYVKMWNLPGPVDRVDGTSYTFEN